MTVTVTDLLAGPARSIRVGLFGATEPADFTAPIDEEDWTDRGGTTGGLRLVADREFFRLDVDQIIGRVGSVPTQEDFSVATSLAEATLENYALTMNKPDASVTTAGGVKKLALGGTLPGSAPNYVALLIEGRAPGGKGRLVIVRKVLSTATVEAGMEKAGQTVYPVTFSAHHVSDSIEPIVLVDEV
jgi:hypothetical protein